MASIRPLAVTLAAFAAGCHGPAYSPYGAQYGTPYMQPYGGQPIQTLTPGPTYVPNGGYPTGTYPGSTVPGSTIPGSPPAGLAPTPDFNNAPRTFGNPSGGLTPIPEPNGAAGAAPLYSPAPGGGNVPVPLPPNSTFVPPINRNPIATNEVDLGMGSLSPAGSTSLEPASGENPFSRGVPAIATEGENPFARPQNDDGEQVELRKPALPVIDEATPFAYDADGHRWLRGVASYDPVDKTWDLVYSDLPDREDELVGHVTLANHDALSGVQDGDIILVEGQLNPVERDSRGRPLYVIRKLTAQGQSAYVKP